MVSKGRRHASLRQLLARRRPSRDSFPRLLVVVEGSKTEVEYFNDLRKLQRASAVDIQVVPGGVPKSVVNKAVQLRDEAARDARQRHDPSFAFDKVWCVIDVDAHPDLDEALDRASAQGISVALSNPNFELWFLLHFQDQRANIDRHAAAAACRSHVPGYVKVMEIELLMPRFSDASARARQLRTWQTEQGRPRGNPWTEVDALVETIAAIGSRVLRN